MVKGGAYINQQINSSPLSYTLTIEVFCCCLLLAFPFVSFAAAISRFRRFVVLVTLFAVSRRRVLYKSTHLGYSSHGNAVNTSKRLRGFRRKLREIGWISGVTSLNQIRPPKTQSWALLPRNPTEFDHQSRSIKWKRKTIRRVVGIQEFLRDLLWDT